MATVGVKGLNGPTAGCYYCWRHLTGFCWFQLQMSTQYCLSQRHYFI